MSVIVDLLAPGAIAAALPIANSKVLIQHLAQVAAREYGLDAGEIAERLHERERLGSTGFGSGVAIPHGKIEGLDHVVGVFVTLEKPIDFKAVDDNPVDVVFCLLSPPDSGTAHLKALAQVSRWLRDAKFVEKLRGADSPDTIYALFDTLSTKHAA
jgi:nitrogen PTS system EIIA component